MNQINFSDFTIIPIISSARREKISDELYFSSKYADFISNSRLGYINPKQDGSPNNYMHPPHLNTQSLFLGSCIHELILQPEVFSLAPKCKKPNAKLGNTLDRIKYYRKRGYSIYDSIINSSRDCEYYVNQINSKIHKIIEEGLPYYLLSKDYDDNVLTLSDRDWDTCYNCVNNVMSNPAITSALHPVDDFMNEIPIFNEDALFMDIVVLYKGRHAIRLKLKAKADNWTIDEENKILTLNDLKTTSKPIYLFMNKELGSFAKYHYSRQFAFYKYILEAYCTKEYGYNHSWVFNGNVLAINTRDYESKLFKVNKSQFEQGKREFEQLIKRVAFYEMFGYNKEVIFK